MLTTPFTAMVKSSSLIFVLGFAFLFKLEQYSLRLVLVIGLITLGVFLMTFHTTAYAWGGVALVLVSSALAGFRWACTQLLLRRAEIGLDSPAATIFWLSPLMGLTVAIVSAGVDDWRTMFASPFFAGWRAVGTTAGMLLVPGVLAFCMVMSEFYLLQRAGIVPTSIVGIFKEVATISLSAWVFGDEMTPLKITGVGVTVGGIALYSYHKYRRTVEGAERAEGYARVREEEEVFALGGDADEDEEDERERHRRRSGAEEEEAVRRASGEADEDSLLGLDEGDEDARSVRTVNTVNTIGSTARNWRER